MTKKVLFVCLGNICRSPMAEGVMNKLAQDASMDVEVDSAGFGRWHVGDPPDKRAISHAGKRGYEIKSQICRRVSVDDFDTFDLILAMDRSNLKKLLAMRPNSSKAKVSLLMDLAADLSDVDVPDPYYSNKFDQSLDVIEFGVKALMAKLRG